MQGTAGSYMKHYEMGRLWLPWQKCGQVVAGRFRCNLRYTLMFGLMDHFAVR